jgi:phthalate 4,5-cis-dihydrodiol dehydrogenase
MNIGIIGLGAFAEYHIKAAKLVNDLQISAVSRRNQAELDAFCKEHGVTGYSDYHDMLKDDSIDAVLIATPHHMHTSIVEDAAKHGKHILLEKPLAENPEGVLRIKQAIESSGVRFMAGFSNHFTKANRKAKEIVESGGIGTIITGTSTVNKYWMVPERRDWHLSRKTGGGMWLTIGIHLIDRLSFLIDSKITSISADLGTHFHIQDAHDSSAAFLRYANGATGFVSAIGYSAGGPIEETLLVGTKGSLKINQKKGVLLGIDDDWVLIEGTQSEDQHVDALSEEWRTFKKYVEQNDSNQLVTMDFALHVMDVVFAGEKSSIEHREVLIES